MTTASGREPGGQASADAGPHAPRSLHRRAALSAAGALLAFAALGIYGMNSRPTLVTRGSSAITTAGLGVDLGPSHRSSITFVALLRRAARPTCLVAWGARSNLRIDWSARQSWVMVTGSAQAIDRALGVEIDNFRASTGRVSWSATSAPRTPSGVCGEVAGIGLLRSYSPPVTFDVPSGGLSRLNLLNAYDATPLARAGDFGQGQTVVFIETDGYAPSDLQQFASDQGLPGYNLVNFGKVLAAGGETEMDIETVHEIAPDARLVYVDLPAMPGSTYAAVLINGYEVAAQRFPGAIYTASLGFCEYQDFNRADITAFNNAMMAIESRGATSFASSGDSAGYDCTPPADIGRPPTQADVGPPAPAVLPAVTGVGGTALYTDAQGNWLGEVTWSEPLLAQGSSGGVSAYFGHPSWQTGQGTGGQVDTGNRREVPDVAADADPFTGNFNIIQGKQSQGGGTSLASPIWAGMTALMDAVLKSQHKRPIGFFNPILYHLANSSQPYPPFHDITVGGNNLVLATPGYDMVTGLGSPDVYNLTRDLLAGGY